MVWRFLFKTKIKIVYEFQTLIKNRQNYHCEALKEDIRFSGQTLERLSMETQALEYIFLCCLTKVGWLSYNFAQFISLKKKSIS